ncbi:MAG: HAD-IIB family hydrolase [Desulfomonilia bacterium]|jgi:mannosyl-3-phosphoglycerate phosphatase
MRRTTKLLVLTDLDGTLLDFFTYSFEAALPALNLLGERGVPVVIVTSKTRAEIEPLLESLPLISKLFVTENGSAVHLDRRFPIPRGLPVELRAGYRVVLLGRRYEEVLDALDRAASSCGVRVTGFRDMSALEVAGLTGLGIEGAARAKDREFSEPFVFEGSEAELRCLKEALAGSGMNCLEGGRLYHALGRSDKGLAARLVIDLFRSMPGAYRWRSVALGDGPNDLAMLKSADVAVIVRRPDGTWVDYDPPTGQRVLRTLGVGPAGWNEAMTELLEET